MLIYNVIRRSYNYQFCLLIISWNDSACELRNKRHVRTRGNILQSLLIPLVLINPYSVFVAKGNNESLEKEIGRRETRRKQRRYGDAKRISFEDAIRVLINFRLRVNYFRNW